MNTDLDNSSTGSEDMEMKVWDYIDGSIPSDEHTKIERLIAENAAWKAKYHELLEVHQLINATELEHPSLRFTKNVMEEIAKYHIAPATKSYINNKVIWGIGIFFITVIVGFLVYGISQINWSDGASNNLIGVNFNKIDYSKIFNNTYVNVFMMLNVVLGLMLLDRVLSNKRKKFMEQSI
jgi:hypothetical protein